MITISPMAGSMLFYMKNSNLQVYSFKLLTDSYRAHTVNATIVIDIFL